MPSTSNGECSKTDPSTPSSSSSCSSSSCVPRTCKNSEIEKPEGRAGMGKFFHSHTCTRHEKRRGATTSVMTHPLTSFPRSSRIQSCRVGVGNISCDGV
ncbi:hypothetical protein EYF80_043084 [Liparis tanakae]|uniref:Uncharacterized protein n=1 Tax=Liparis tanakae TaxID=230148 RepID=A0A4Z2G0T2_9TELE|nr:hypothetical protein EYF80_043084 [Liparis tanakae]